MPGAGQRYWADRTARARRPSYGPYRGHQSADVVVIGGGLTGAVAAFVLAGGGLDVVLVEADRLASGGTADGLGVIQPEPASSFVAVERQYGRRIARAAWTETRRSVLDFAAAIRRLPSRVELEPAPLLLNARHAGGSRDLQRDRTARQRAGLLAPWLTPAVAGKALCTTSAGALRLKDAFLHDPVRTTLACARAAAARGARICERSPVRRTRFDRHGAEVHLEKGVIRTPCVFVATATPGPLFRSLRRHVREQDAWAVVTEPFTAAMRREVGPRRSILMEAGDEWHALRWLPDHRGLFMGRGGAPVPPRLRDRRLPAETGELMYELSLRYPVMSGLPARWAWRVPITTTTDGLPWIGPHRNYPFHYFAFALGAAGDALAWFAAKAALRHFTDAARREDDVFSFRG